MSSRTTPDFLDYQGRIKDALGKPRNGTCVVAFHFLDPSSKLEIMIERHQAVEICGGQFSVRLGSGDTSDGVGPGQYESIGSLFRDYPDLLMQVEVDGVFQAPRVRLEPAGHSAKTRYLRSKRDGGPLYSNLMTSGALAGVPGRSNEDPPASRWKGWESPSPATAVQAAELEPAVPGSTDQDLPVDGMGEAPSRRGAMLLEVIGPGESLPLRDLPVAPKKEFKDSEQEINPMKQQTLWDEHGNLFGTTVEKSMDPLLSRSESNPDAPLTPSLDRSWDGIPISGYLPPDNEGAVGPNHFVQAVNVRMQIWNKTGTSLVGPVNTNGLWSTFGGPCQTDNDGDAIVLYDRQADRWVISQFAVSTGQAVCMAISKTADPTGEYWLYQVNTQRFPDYFKLGTWPDPSNNAYFMGTNSGYQTQYDVYAMDRQNMLAGNTARAAQFFQSYPNLMLPADCDGPDLPPNGSPGYFYSFRDGGEAYFGSPASDSLDVFEFHVNWTTPASSTFSRTQALTPSSGGFAPFNWTTCGFFVNCCLSQPGTTIKVAGGDWWPMKRLVYRNFPGAREALVGSWTVDATGSGTAGIRWFDLSKTNQSPGGAWAIANQGTHSPDETNRWMPSVAMDRMGNIALGYSAVNATTNVYPSIRYATRLASDPAGTMQTEASLHAGASSQTSTSCRWGDYSSMTVDPANDCTFWYTSQYIVGGTWRTRIGAFTIPGCLCVTPGVPSIGTAAVPGDNQIAVSWSAGSPAGATYKIYRAMGDCTSPGAFSLLATGITGSPYTDNTVSGTVTYAYKVTAVDSTGGCESAQSGCVFATATGACISPPTFAGITGVTNPGEATCTLNLAWAAGTAHCGGPIYYNVYRSTTSGFAPGSGTLLYSGVVSTSLTDINVASGTRYYYVVRAVDNSSGAEDSNLAERSGTPYGSVTPATLLSENFDTWAEGAYGTGWAEGFFIGDAVDWRGAMACSGQSSPNILRCGGNNCTNDYGDDKHAFARTPQISVPAGSDTSRLSFYHRWIWETDWDGGYLRVSLDGTNYTYVAASALLSGPTYNTTVGAWSGTQSTMTQTVVDLDAALNAATGGTGGAAGQSFYIAFVEYTDTNTNYDGWFIDDATVTANVPGGCSGPTAAPRPVPDGSWISGTPIKASKNTGDGSSLNLTWDVSTCVDTDYNAYYGIGSAVSNYALTGSECTLGNSGSATWNPAPAVPGGETFLWWVIAGTDGVQTESSWGKDSAGNERHPAASAQCGFTAKSTATTCP